jgi:Trk K+ transport system NAD-binding subunit
VAISINETLVNSIQKVIRKSYARSIYNFGDSNLEMLEINVSKRPEMIGKTIQEVKLPRNSLVIMVTRQEDHIIPQGNLTIEAEDFLMLITTKENIQELE